MNPLNDAGREEMKKISDGIELAIKDLEQSPDNIHVHNAHERLTELGVDANYKSLTSEQQAEVMGVPRLATENLSPEELEGELEDEIERRLNG